MNDGTSRIVTFALPDESRPFLEAFGTVAKLGLRSSIPTLTTHRGQIAGHSVTVVHTGVGELRAGRTWLEELLTSSGKLRWVISAGYAGGLAPGLAVGDLVLGQNYSDPALLAAAVDVLAADPPRVGSLLTEPVAVETVAAKASLHAASGALAVDMETRWIADLCAQAGVPLLSLRVISDAANQSFPVPGHVLFDAVHQRPRYFALPLHLLTHPSRTAPFVRFVRSLSPARARLTCALRTLVSAL